MIFDANLIAYDFMTDFNGPKRHFPAPFYPSGVYDNEKPVYKFGPESSEYPTLILPCNLEDDEGNFIQHGHYMVVLAENQKYLDLYQSNTLKARVKTIKVIEKMYTQEELDEEAKIIYKLEQAKLKKKLKKFREAEEELIAFKERAAANSSAEIYNSGKGYYIIKYRHKGKQATGIIQN